MTFTYAQYDRYTAGTYGHCPRFFCQDHPLLPIGMSSAPQVHSVKVFCPQCLDLYYPSPARFRSIDGCAFGPTASHLLFYSFPELQDRGIAPLQTEVYFPRVFGFKVNEAAATGPHMRWLRTWRALDGQDDNDDDDDEDIDMPEAHAVPISQVNS
jgi:casein kinase II subunit beta